MKRPRYGYRVATGLSLSCWLAAAGLVVGAGERPAAARPLRQPGVHALLQDLAELESYNAERDDQNTAGLIAQPLAVTRGTLLRVLGGVQPLGDGLQATLANLRVIAGYNRRAQDRDPEVRQRIGASLDRLQRRAEQGLAAPELAAAAQPQYAPQPPYPPQPQYAPQPPYPPQPQYAPQPPYPPQPQYAPQQPVPMSKAAFAELLKELQRRSFSDEKLNLARDAVTGGAFFTCEQVGQMMRTASFGDDQVKIAATLYPRIVDPQNFIQLTSILTFESDRQKLRQLVGR